MPVPDNRFFFLRFYGQPIDTIAKCLKEILALPDFPKPVAVEYGPMVKSVNPGIMFLLANEEQPIEVVMRFPSAEGPQMAVRCRAAMDIYQRYSTNERLGGGSIEIRRPGDISFGV